jgi:hypothetical protein
MSAVIGFPHTVDERAARVVAGGVVAGLCLACKMFPLLVRVGLASEADCEECSDIWTRLSRRVPAHSHRAPEPTADGEPTPSDEPAQLAVG